MFRIALSVCLASIAFSEESALAQARQPIPESVSLTKLVRIYLVSGDDVFVTVAEVDSAGFAKLATGDKASLTAATYRLSANHKSCEAFAPIGNATKISDTQIAIELSAESRNKSKTISERLTSTDGLKRHALMFVPNRGGVSLDYAGKSIKEFADAVQPQIDAGGMIAYPVEVGHQARATTCKCKAFFGCTDGCCTNPDCKVIIGICQSNSECKKVDLTSNCSCRE